MLRASAGSNTGVVRLASRATPGTTRPGRLASCGMLSRDLSEIAGAARGRFPRGMT